MRQPHPIRPDCLICGRRGVIRVGGQDQPFPCPGCSAWCTFCLADVDRLPRVFRGTLVAGVPCTDGDVLFKGYVCDIHKRCLRSSSCIGPWMLDAAQYSQGTPYIIVQWERAFVVLYGLGEATNWQDLEKDARAAVSKQDNVRMHGGIGFAVCPAELAARATK